MKSVVAQSEISALKKLPVQERAFYNGETCEIFWSSRWLEGCMPELDLLYSSYILRYLGL